MAKLSSLLFAFLLALLIACGGGDDESDVAGVTDPDRDCDLARAHAAGEFDRTLLSGGVERQYILHVPPQYDGETAMPLVLLLHGFALTGRIMLDYSELGAVADREGFIIASPTALGDPPRWNSRVLPDDPGDLAFLTELIDTISSDLCVDTERVFATGYSNGGGMSMRLACDIPDKVGAVGLIASVFIDCTPGARLIAFHGIQDELVPFEGAGTFPSIRQAVASWAAALNCGPDPVITDVTARIELETYDGCTSGDGATQLYMIDGAGHTWPGARLLGDQDNTTHEISASDLIWRFFIQE
jgi:polyhydroxybutyrate depolymerase